MKAFSWEVEQLTGVAMMAGSDGALFIGADSQWTDSEGLKFYKPELTVFNGAGNIIVWGTAGNPEIGFTEFGEWLKARGKSDESPWSRFIVEVASEFARLNTQRRKIDEEAGEDITSKEWRESHLCSMLIGGWLNNRMGGYFVGNNGAYQSLSTVNNFQTVGTGAPHAEAVFSTQVYLEAEGIVQQTEDKRVEHVMMLASRYAPGCSLPFEVIKVTTSEVARYRSEEPKSELIEMPPEGQSETGNNEP